MQRGCTPAEDDGCQPAFTLALAFDGADPILSSQVVRPRAMEADRDGCLTAARAGRTFALCTPCGGISTRQGRRGRGQGYEGADVDSEAVRLLAESAPVWSARKRALLNRRAQNMSTQMHNEKKHASTFEEA